MDLRDEKLAIIEIQKNLRELRKGGWDLPAVIADGVYGSVTRDAVRRFQEIQDLPATGRVDAVTWQVLATAADLYRKDRSDALPIYPWNRPLRGGGLSPGDQSDLVYLIQLMLRESLPHDLTPPLTGILDKPTMQAVADFQSRHDLPPTGLPDRYTWDALADAYNKYLPQSGEW